jgi:photosystem II stability/assembly factor-like uncharacterized protein
MTIWKMAIRLAGLCMVALLAGCVVAPISKDQRLTGQEGAVILKIVTNTSTTTFNPVQVLSTVTLKRQPLDGVGSSGESSSVLLRTMAVTKSTAVFSGMVPPGRYRLSHGTGGGDRMAYYTFPMDNMLSHFEVKSGEVSLLGTLLVQVFEDKRFVVGYAPADRETSGLIEALFPNLAEQTRGKPANTFEPSPELTRQAALSWRLRQIAPTAYSSPMAGPQGTMLAGGKMGRVILRRAGDSRWRILQVDTWKEVLSVHHYRGGLLAAGEAGLLRYSTDEGKSWVPLTPPDHGLIAAVAPLPDGKVIALVRRDMLWTAYASEDLMVGTWRKVGAFAEQSSLNLPGQIGAGLVIGNGAAVLMPNGEFYAINGSSEIIERSSTGYTTLDVQVLADGMLVVRGALMSSTTLVSLNGGKTWTDLKTSTFVRAISFADRHTVYAIAPVAPNITPGAFGLMVSRDGARTWSKSGEVPGDLDDIRYLSYDRSDGSLFAFMWSGVIFRSTDEGKTWTRSL